MYGPVPVPPVRPLGRPFSKSRSGPRRLALTPVLAVTAVLALCAPAAEAQTTATVYGKVTRSATSTTLELSGGQRTADGSQPPTVARLELFFPRQLGYDPRGLPTCRPAALERKGVAGCAKGSRIGTGFVKAQAGTLLAEPKLTLFNRRRRCRAAG